jgi:hypothetical protein
MSLRGEFCRSIRKPAEVIQAIWHGNLYYVIIFYFSWQWRIESEHISKKVCLWIYGNDEFVTGTAAWRILWRRIRRRWCGGGGFGGFGGGGFGGGGAGGSW